MSLSNGEISNRLIGRKIKDKPETIFKTKTNTKKQKTINKLISELIPTPVEFLRSKNDYKLNKSVNESNKHKSGGYLIKTKNTFKKQLIPTNSTDKYTTRQLYINKYSNVDNTNPNKDTLLNRTIKKYIVITPTQQILSQLTDEEINTNENMEAEIASIPQAPSIAQMPAPPNQIPKSSPQLVPEALSRPEMNILEQIRQGKTLRKNKEKQESLDIQKINILDQLSQGKQNLRKNKEKGYQIQQVEQDPNGTHKYVMEKLKGIRQYVKDDEPDEDWIGEGFIQDKRNQNVLNMYRRQLVYGF